MYPQFASGMLMNFSCTANEHAALSSASSSTTSLSGSDALPDLLGEEALASQETAPVSTASSDSPSDQDEAASIPASPHSPPDQDEAPSTPASPHSPSDQDEATSTTTSVFSLETGSPSEGSPHGSQAESEEVAPLEFPLYMVGYSKWKSQTCPFRQRDFKGILLKPLMNSICKAGTPAPPVVLEAVRKAMTTHATAVQDLTVAAACTISYRLEAGLEVADVGQYVQEMLAVLRPEAGSLFLGVPSRDLAERWGILSGSLIQSAAESYKRTEESGLMGPAEVVLLSTIDAILDYLISTGSTLGYTGGFLWNLDGLGMMRAIKAAGTLDFGRNPDFYDDASNILVPNPEEQWARWAGRIYNAFGRTASRDTDQTTASFWRTLGEAMELLAGRDVARTKAGLLELVKRSYWASVQKRAGFPVAPDNVPLQHVQDPPDNSIRERSRFVRLVFNSGLLASPGYKTATYLKLVKCVEGSLLGTALGRTFAVEGVSFLDFLAAELSKPVSFRNLFIFL